jgi:ABC-type microcin C transport system duplicated ATPase subunit YejF
MKLLEVDNLKTTFLRHVRGREIAMIFQEPMTSRCDALDPRLRTK